MLIVKSLRVQQREEWNRFVQRHPLTSPLQLWEWGEVKQSSLWQVYHWGVFQRQKLIALALLFKRRLKGGWQLLYSPHGPLLPFRNQVLAARSLDILLTRIKKEFGGGRTLFCRLEPRATKKDFPWWGQNAGEEIFPLRPYFKSIQPRYTTVLDLRPPLKQILQRMDKDTRYSIRRAAREGVEVVKTTKGRPEKYWPLFYDLYLHVSRKGFSPRPWSQFRRLQQLMAPRGGAEVFLAFRPPNPLQRQADLPQARVSRLPPGAEVIAAAIILRSGKYAAYLWGGSRLTSENKKFFAPYLLQWEIIRFLKQEGVADYDLWGISPSDDPRHSWYGHSLFKKGFGGVRQEWIGSWDLPLSPFYRPFSFIDWLRQRVLQPDLITRPLFARPRSVIREGGQLVADKS